MKNNTKINTYNFLILLQSGLWNKALDYESIGIVDWTLVFKLAEEQSIIGLVLTGIEKLPIEYRPPQDQLLQCIGAVHFIEQRNAVMNKFLIGLFNKLKVEDIQAVLVKGQAVAQNYERPQWRHSGDIDLLLSPDNYKKAKALLIPLADNVQEENKVRLHQGLSINGFWVELHGRMPFVLSKRVDDVLDDIIASIVNGENYLWNLDHSGIAVPNIDNDVILIFTHYLHHFFIEGVGLRQICDWSRLLWVNRNVLNKSLLGERLRAMGLVSEWKVFGALAVDYLGMPSEAMPLYDKRFKYKKKANLALNHILKCGDMGQMNDLSYRVKYDGLSYKIVSLRRRLCDFVKFSRIFPIDAPKFFFTYLFSKFKVYL